MSTLSSRLRRIEASGGADCTVGVCPQDVDRRMNDEFYCFSQHSVWARVSLAGAVCFCSSSIEEQTVKISVWLVAVAVVA